MKGRRLVRHLYALALASLVGGASLGVFLTIYKCLSGPLGEVLADLIALGASIVALFLLMLLAYKITANFVQRNYL